MVTFKILIGRKEHVFDILFFREEKNLFKEL
jgi:hypothetical protein